MLLGTGVSVWRSHSVLTCCPPRPGAPRARRHCPSRASGAGPAGRSARPWSDPRSACGPCHGRAWLLAGLAGLLLLGVLGLPAGGLLGLAGLLVRAVAGPLGLLVREAAGRLGLLADQAADGLGLLADGAGQRAGRLGPLEGEVTADVDR